MSSWKGKTRGGVYGYKIFIYIIKNFGLSPAYFLLYFVTAYFVVSAPKASYFSFKYFSQILKWKTWKSLVSIYKSYYVFGQSLIDKIAIGSGMRNYFEYSFDGKENLDELTKTGGIVLRAHLGNWDIASYLFDKIQFKTNILMFEAEQEKINSQLKKVITEGKVNIIPIKQDMSHVFQINKALKNKELICIHGDRFIKGSRVVEKEFIGKTASFPLGPFSIISKFEAPYTFAYAVRGKKKEYFLSSTPIQKAKEAEAAAKKAEAEAAKAADAPTEVVAEEAASEEAVVSSGSGSDAGSGALTG